MIHPVVVIVQARMSSERLPGKVMKPVMDKPLLGYLLDQLAQVKLADRIVVATSTSADDQPIVDYCQQRGVDCYRGDLHDVLGRYAGAADAFQARTIVRICADCPLIDPSIVDRVISAYQTQERILDYVSDTQHRTFPRGQDVEVFSRAALDTIAKIAKLPEEREHVTPYIYRHPELFRMGDVVESTDLSSHRWVVDTAADFELVSRILTELEETHTASSMQAILSILQKHPDWVALNANVPQREVSS